MDTISPIHAAIRKHTSERKLAQAIGISQVAINRAKRRVEEGKPLSTRMAMLLSDELGIPRHELRPDLWSPPHEDS